MVSLLKYMIGSFTIHLTNGTLQIYLRNNNNTFSNDGYSSINLKITKV